MAAAALSFGVISWRTNHFVSWRLISSQHVQVFLSLFSNHGRYEVGRANVHLLEVGIMSFLVHDLGSWTLQFLVYTYRSFKTY